MLKRKMNKKDCTRYANDIFNTLIKPFIFKYYKQADKTYPHINIVVNEDNGITNDDIECGSYDIFTIFKQKTCDYFEYRIEDGALDESGFVIIQQRTDKPDGYHWFSPNDNCPSLESFDDVSNIIEILKTKILKLYKQNHKVNIYTEKEYQLQRVHELYAEIANIKSEYNLSDKELADAKTCVNCKSL